MPNLANQGVRPWTVFLIFLKLGLTSFGGPMAHLGYFHQEFVTRRKWLSERAYTDLMALCHFLPGPTSSQISMAIGMMQCSYKGALAAWCGFTLPSAAFLAAAAIILNRYDHVLNSGMIQGLKIVAVAVVAQAILNMARQLCTDRMRISFMLTSACVALLWPFLWTQVLVIGVAALFGNLFLPSKETQLQHARAALHAQTHIIAVGALGLFFILLLLLPLASHFIPIAELIWFDSFYRAGALVFGGGHVVLPLLENELIPAGWVSQERFLAGYGITQAMPGPLFTFAAYLGASFSQASEPWAAALLCIIAIFLPSFLILAGVLPFWEKLRLSRRVQSALSGVGAAVVGLLLAALYQPVWSSTITLPRDFALLAVVFCLLQYWRMPPWSLVLICALLGAVAL